MDFKVREARPDDANGISGVILAALRETNAKDYPPHVIAEVERSFCVAAVSNLIANRKVFVATTGNQLVGTASLVGYAVRTVFVGPDFQGLGVGRLLMTRIEEAARSAGFKVLKVPSSTTAEPFYGKLGYKAVREIHNGDERTIVMERDL